MTATRDGALLDRRRVELIDPALPSLPHHHDCQKLPVPEAVALIERVRASANEHAAACLEALAAELPVKLTAIALCKCPPLPPTVPERITDYRAQCVADSVMFREALAGAAQARGWSVAWYETKRVFADAAQALDTDDINAFLADLRAALGPPWQQDHKTAMAAAIAAAGGRL